MRQPLRAEGLFMRIVARLILVSALGIPPQLVGQTTEPDQKPRQYPSATTPSLSKDNPREPKEDKRTLESFRITGLLQV
jgi:hypothetical protein